MSSDVFCTSPAKTRANGVRRRENEKNAAGKGAGCRKSKKSGPACRTGTIRTGSGAADFRLNPVIRLADTARYLQNRKPRERRQKHERETAGNINPAPRRGVCFDVCGSARGFECHVPAGHNAVDSTQLFTTLLCDRTLRASKLLPAFRPGGVTPRAACR